MNDILNALASSQYKPAETGYGLGAQGINAALTSGALVNPYGSVGSNAGMTLGAGILSALLTNFARTSANEDNIALSGLQSEFLNPQTTSERRTALMHEQPRLGPLQAVLMGNAFNLVQKQQEEKMKLDTGLPYEVAKEQRGINNDILKATGGATIDLNKSVGKVFNPLTGQTEQVIDPYDEAAKKIKIEARAQAEAKDEALRNKYGADAGVPKVIAQPDLEEAQSKLQGTFNALPEVKTFSIVKASADSLSKALKDKGSVSDLELVRRSIQMIEPGMAVREGEQAAVTNSQSIPDAWKGQLDKALRGETSLDDGVRKGIKALAERAYNAQKTQYDLAYDFYKKEADIKGLDNSRVSYLGDSPDSSALFGPGQNQQIPAGMKLQVNKLTGESRLVPQ